MDLSSQLKSAFFFNQAKKKTQGNVPFAVQPPHRAPVAPVPGVRSHRTGPHCPPRPWPGSKCRTKWVSVANAMHPLRPFYLMAGAGHAAAAAVIAEHITRNDPVSDYVIMYMKCCASIVHLATICCIHLLSTSLCWLASRSSLGCEVLHCYLWSLN